MPKAQLPTPDSISGGRSIQTPYSDLSPAAKPISNFQQATLVEQAGPAQDNMLSQLGRALEKVNPALQALGNEYSKLRDEQAIALAESMKRGDPELALAQAVKDNRIPAGANPAFIQAFNMTDLRTKTTKYGAEVFKAYDESGLADNDDPAAFDRFLTEYRQTKRKEYVSDKQGNQQYTDLEIHKSEFDSRLDAWDAQLRSQHVQHRAAERTKIGLDVASNNAASHLDWMAAQPKDERDYARMATAINNSFRDPVTGIARHGLSYKTVNDAIVDTVRNKIIETGDTSLEEVLKHIPTAEGNYLAGGKYAREQMKQARESVLTEEIRRKNWDWTQRERNAMEDVGLGPEAQAEIKADQERRRQENEKRQDLQFKHWLVQADKADHEFQKNMRSESHVSRILGGLQNGDPYSKKYQPSFEWLRVHAPKEWEAINTYIRSYQREKGTFVDTEASRMNEARLRADMSLNPKAFNAARIIKMANDGLINPAHVGPLFDDWDRTKTHVDHPFMQSQDFQRTLENAARAAQADDKDIAGMGAIRGNNARTQMMRYAYEWLDRNKENPDYNKFQSDMNKNLEIILQDNAPEFARDQASKEKKSKTQKVTPPDTRSTLEKYTPNFLGGESAPKPVEKQVGPPPMGVKEAFSKLKPEESQAVMGLLQDPNADEEHLNAALTYFMGPVFRSNGRSSSEFAAWKQQVLKNRGAK